MKPKLHPIFWPCVVALLGFIGLWLYGRIGGAQWELKEPPVGTREVRE